MSDRDDARPLSAPEGARAERVLHSVADLPDTPTPAYTLSGTVDGFDRADLIAELVQRFEMADRRGAIARSRELLAAGLDDRELRDIVGAAVRHVGDLWQAGHWTITQEHAATAVAEAVLTSLESTASHAETVGAVAVVAADGEWHSLPARLASHAFEFEGLTVRYLGAGVPADDVARTLPSADADVLAISVTVTANIPGAARTVAAGHAARLPVILGGAAATASRARSIGADGFAASVDEGARLARRWCEEGAPPLAEPDVDQAPADALLADRTRLRDAAYDGVAVRWPELDEAAAFVIDRVVEDLELHLDHLTAALLLREDDAYTDLLPWLRDVQSGRGLGDVVLEAQLGALTAVLGDHPEARDLLARSAAASGVDPI